MTERLSFLSRPAWPSLKTLAGRVFFWGGAVVVALVAILFAKASLVGSWLFFLATRDHPWLALVIVPAGLATVVAVTRRFFPGSEGSGIPQTIAALKIKDFSERRSVLSLRVSLGKILLTFVGLSAGASVGREGPTVQIGAAIMHALGRWRRLPFQAMENTLITAGGAAGIAAAFNTPLAGVVFAIEELTRSFEERTSGTVLTAVIIAGIVSMAVLDNYTYFGHTDAALELAEAWQPVFVCGLLGGLLGGLFARILILVDGGLPGRMGRFLHERPVLFAALCGLGLALLGLMTGSTVYGTGYDEARSLIEGTRAMPQSFGVAKFLATVLSYISGIPGGIFAPSLAIGAGLGENVTHLFPNIPAGAVIILGMVSFFAGAVQAPITAAVIVMEMTDNQSLTIPLLAASLIAFGVSRLLCPASLYSTLARAFIEKSVRRSPREAGASAETAAPDSSPGVIAIATVDEKES